MKQILFPVRMHCCDSDGPSMTQIVREVTHFTNCVVFSTAILHISVPSKEQIASIVYKSTIYSQGAFEMEVRSNSNRRTLANNCAQNSHLGRWVG